jgi:hypothetical protein
LPPGAAREAIHKIDTLLTRAANVLADGFVVGTLAAEAADGLSNFETVEDAAVKLEIDAEQVVTELTEDTLVVRGGVNEPSNFENGSGVVRQPNGALSNVSVNSAPGKTAADLSKTIRNGQIGVTTVGEVKAAGGTITLAGTPTNPSHCLLCNLTAQQLSKLFTPTQPNPNKK